MEKLKIFILASVLFFSLSLVFAATALKAEVDKLKLSTDEALTYKLTVSAGQPGLPRVELPKFEGFAVLSNIQSSNISLSAGKVQSEAVYTLVLRPLSVGKIKIPASALKMDKQSVTSEEFEIEVTQGKRPLPKKPLPVASDKPQYDI